MASFMSAGDIFQLSQIAWGIGRSFTTGTKPCPLEFHQIKSAADELSDVLQSLSDTLDTNGELLASAPPSLQDAIKTIVQSARITLENLEALVDRYRVVSKTQTAAGFVVGKDWSDIVLNNYKRMFWTAEKGDIEALRDMLQMHSNTIALTVKALQSGQNESLTEKVDDVRRISATISTSSLHLRTVESDARSFSSQQPQGLRVVPAMQPVPFNRQLPSPPRSPPLRPRDPSRVTSPTRPTTPSLPSSIDRIDSGLDSKIHHSLAGFVDDLTSSNRDKTDSSSYNPDSPNVPKRIPSVKEPTQFKRRDSETLPSLLEKYAEITNPTPAPRRLSTAASVTFSAAGDPHTPASLFSNSSLIRSSDSNVDSFPGKQAQATFFKKLFRNSARLFDDHAQLVEYTVVNEDEPDTRFNTELKPAAKDCRICVLRKRETRANGATNYTTSIWIVSSDFSTRIQQRLPDFPEPIPLLSSFQREKVSLSGDTTLRQHSDIPGDLALSETRTGWINYIFGTADAANHFQSAVFGRLLLDSFRTEKSVVVHDGFRGTFFAFEEQMCGIESLRVWKDDGLATPGAGGGVMVLIHLSPSFGEGWIRFWINNSRAPARIESDGGRFVRIRDMRLVICRCGGQKGAYRWRSVSSGSSGTTAGKSKKGLGQSQGQEKVVSGMRIEFSTEEEKGRFMGLVLNAQANMIALPDI